jgi:hypothetical protein
MDGAFYIDSRAPHASADAPQVTLIATNVALVPIANLPILGSNYFNYVGKACRLTMLGRFSSVATPGTVTFSLLWGSGASNVGTVLASTAALTLVASQTNITWQAQFWVRCRALGATGSLIVTGTMNINPVLVASTAQPIMIPASAPAPVTVDLTAANVLSPQALCTTATTNTVTVHEFLFESLN